MSILGPILAQVALTIAVVFWLAYTRFSYIGKHGIAKVRESGFPVRAVNASDNFKNQFEVPVLFYVVCLGYLYLNAVPVFVVWLAWLFVALRAAHSLVQLGPNIIFPWRFGLFVLSTLVVVAMTVMLVISKIGQDRLFAVDDCQTPEEAEQVMADAAENGTGWVIYAPTTPCA